MATQAPNGSKGTIGLSKYTYKELAKATGKFSNQFHLGEGGFGQVFWAFLDDEIRAIKKLRYLPDVQKEELEHEIRVISSVSHKNLVKLVGYCIDGANGLLVLEYLPNGSLKSHLHGKNILDWSKRIDIAKGCALGLEYLHNHCERTPIIHQDIKSDNILLNKNFKPKLADFGLALYFPDSITHLSRTIKGTEVYMDPEYSGKVSTKSDVYSFGVVLLELITGREPLHEGVKIVDWAKTRITQALKGDYKDFVDVRLQKYDKGEMEKIIYCAKGCVYNPPEFRPSMREIVRFLEGAKLEKNLWIEKIDNEMRRSTINRDASSSGIERLEIHKPEIFTYEQLTKATEGFSMKNLLGKGSLGQVYKGYLINHEVTVKKFSHMPRKQEDAFEKMKAICSSVHHNNLVKLIGYCDEGGNKLLVFEFVSEDKSLRSHLHAGNARSTVDWPTRMEIALGIAKGLVDLHEQYKRWNIYEHFKDDSIFLDGNFQLKFAEYGRAKFLSTYVGFTPSTYAKTDVYFFGAILLELITGKQPNDDISIVEWAESVPGDRLLHGEYDFVDKKLQNNFDENKMIRMIKCALACVRRFPQERPQMSRVVEVLAGNINPEYL
ncbi:proline-rich receptor-like protein kinase PERK15 [Hevea brasiliensis]|uniref:proline-rich receptor-like protein kinase PERK15 n=1 Tax=Hevea brasiliensis TaxID=3981 RepID=UPI0025D88A61|nr:proline-rich receptor-like protein kinase PERK15 [Hevea brasiliensis]